MDQSESFTGAAASTVRHKTQAWGVWWAPAQPHHLQLTRFPAGGGTDHRQACKNYDYAGCGKFTKYSRGLPSLEPGDPVSRDSGKMTRPGGPQQGWPCPLSRARGKPCTETAPC